MESIVWAPVAVTAPARDRPFMVAPPFKVIEVLAKMVPSRSQPIPIVAELPTCQKMLAACAPLIRITLQLPVVSVSVDAGIWKIQTALGSPWASRVRFAPVISNEFAADL